jgi:hypothetical protein
MGLSFGDLVGRQPFGIGVARLTHEIADLEIARDRCRSSGTLK